MMKALPAVIVAVFYINTSTNIFTEEMLLGMNLILLPT